MRSVFCKLNPAKAIVIPPPDIENIDIVRPSSNEYRNELKNMLIDRHQHLQEIRRRVSNEAIKLNVIPEPIEDNNIEDNNIIIEDNNINNLPIEIEKKLQILTRKTTPPIEEIKPIPPIEKKRLPRGRRPVVKPPQNLPKPLN